MTTTCQPANNGAGVTDLGGGSPSNVITKVGLTILTGSPYLGQTPTSISFKLKKDGNPTGDGFMAIRDSDGTLLKQSDNTHNWGTELTDSYQSFAFDFTGAAALELDDIIVVEGGTFDNGNKVRVNISENTPREYSDQVATKLEGSIWSQLPTRNPDVCITYGSSPPPSSSGVLLPPPIQVFRI